MSGSFHFDDYSLSQNPIITGASGLWRMWGPFQTRPITNLTFWINYHLGGANPIGYHLVNLLLHLSAVLLLYMVLRIMMPETCAFWSAALFAIHPIQSEAVCYVFARSTLLSTVFCLLSLWFWIRNRWSWSIAFFALALLAKEEAVTFPLVLLLFTSRTKPRLKAIAIMIGLSFLAGVRAAWATAHIAGSGAGFSAGVGPFAYLSTQGSAILRYLRLLVIPWGFTIDPTVTLSPPWLYAAAWAIVLALVASAIWAFRKHYAWAVWLLAGFLLLIPSSTVFPAADLAADRRMYLPMIGFAAAFGTIAPLLWSFVPAALLAVFLVLSIGRTEVWRTEQGLWREALQRSPEHVRPLLQLAHVVPQQEALDFLVMAKTMEPKNAAIAAELGRAWLLSGSYAFALQEFGRALALDPTNANAFNNRGAALLALKQPGAAKLDFERALRLDPCVEAARRNLTDLGATNLPPCPATAK